MCNSTSITNRSYLYLREDKEKKIRKSYSLLTNRMSLYIKICGDI